jgi:hypothetical protein
MVLESVIRSKTHWLYVTSFSTTPARASFHAKTVCKLNDRNAQATTQHK